MVIKKTVGSLARPLERRLGRLDRRKAVATGLAVVAVLMLGSAGWLAAYPFYTDWRAGRQQTALTADFNSDQTKLNYENGVFPEGAPLTRIIIPALKVDTIVVQGISLRALSAGAGHYPRTPLPGEVGNVAIAGHRTMNGKPFSNLQNLSDGDRIELVTPFSRHIYEVSAGRPKNPRVISPEDESVLAQGNQRMLTLTTCNPRGSDKQRLVVQAALISSESLS